MLRAGIDLIFGGLLLWFSVSGIRSGVKYGIFPGVLLRTRASREQRPIVFWANILFRAALLAIALLYISVVVVSVMRGREAP